MWIIDFIDEESYRKQEIEMKTYRVEGQYVVSAVYTVQAKDEKEARQIAKRDTGMNVELYTSNDAQFQNDVQGVVDWDFDRENFEITGISRLI